MAETKSPGAPKGLAQAGRALWRAVAGWQVDGDVIELRPDELGVLTTACRVADAVAEIEAGLIGQPLTVEGSRGQTIVHPLIAELRQQRALLAALLGRLSLPDAGEWDEMTASQRARRAAMARWR